VKPSDLFPNPRAALLVDAAMAWDEEGARRLVTDGVPVNVRGRQGVTPLLWAVADGDVRAMDILLRLGADTRAVDERGRSVMAIATMNPRVEVLDTLLAAGGDPNDRTPEGDPILLLAIDGFYWDHMDALRRAGADINATDPRGQTAILRLAMLSQYDQIERILQWGAKPDVVDASGLTLARLMQTGNLDPESSNAAFRERVRKMLLSRGINVSDAG
jgi:ankyrin repeat protein